MRVFKDHAGVTSTPGASGNMDKPVQHHPLRSIENLYVHADTFDCVMKKRCVPCGYKIVLNPRTGLLPNQRPEQCPRIKTDSEATASATEAIATEEAAAATTDDAAPTKAKHCVIGLYDEHQVQRILTVGDGNFSFSLALARAFVGSSTGVELVVTSHESRASVVETYPDGERILQELAGMAHVQVKHTVDATDAAQMAKFGTFDRILWNFPCVRVPRGKDGQNEEMELNKTLLNDFFKHIGSMLTATGEVHVTHKTKPPFSQWGMEEIAARNGLQHAQSVVFDRCLYPCYSNKKVLSKGSFPIWDSQTFVFVPATRTAQETQPLVQNVAALTPVTTEMLEKLYLILTPTLQEKMEQQERLLKMQQRQLDAAGGKSVAKSAQQPKKKKAKTEAATGNVGGKKRKQDAPLAHQKNKNKKQKNKHPRR